MTSPGIHVEIFSELSGISKPTVTQVDRDLAEAGFRSKGGRGPSAVKIKPRDTSSLIVGILGADRVMDAVRAVERYGLATLDAEASIGTLDPTGVASLEALPADHSFIDMIEALIKGAATGELQTTFGRYYREKPGSVLAPLRMVGPDFEISAEFPSTVGRIQIFGERNCTLVYGLPILRKVSLSNIDAAIAEVEKIEGAPRGDLRQMRWVTSGLIYKLGEKIFREGVSDG